jgi:TATA-box binding protein (TBP) (component of TFIID and TFIIIB)
MNQDQVKVEKKDFKSIPVSTKTFTSVTNVTIHNLKDLFDYISVVPYYPDITRKMKQFGDFIRPKMDMKNGDIITLKYGRSLKGIDLKDNKDDVPPFRNSFTAVMYVRDKLINFKLCKNGTFQMTGCKNKIHAVLCVYNMWKLIKDTDLFTFTDGKTHLKASFIPAMRNIDFNQNYIIDQEKLAIHMSNHSKFYCLLETNFGYTGTNIKISIDKPILDLIITNMVCYKNNKCSFSRAKYSTYLDTLNHREREKRLKSRYNTFLVFHSGKIIMSGINSTYMKNAYHSFVDLMINDRVCIEEKLNTDKIDLSKLTRLSNLF